MTIDNDFVILKGLLLRYKGTYPFVEIPDGIVTIGKEVFSHSDIRTVKIPDTVTNIDDDAFSNCRLLFKVDMSKSLKRIGRNAFTYCFNLEEIELPSGLIEISSGAFSECLGLKGIKLPDTVEKIGSYAFRHTNIEEICIPEGVTTIYDDTFSYCRNLKSVVLPQNLKSIWWKAFCGCKNLTNINFPDTLVDIGEDAFSGCDGLVMPIREQGKIEPQENGFIIINNDLSYYNGNDRVIRIPEGVKSINANTFNNNRRLSKVILPNSLTKIGAVAFGECENLREINISSTITDIANNAFIRCRKLANEKGFVIINKVLYGYYGHDTTVEIPNGVEIIGTCAFTFSDRDFEEIVLPETVDVIEEDAFSCCRNLRRVLMPKKIRRIDEGAFSNCDNLETVVIPDGIEVLATNTFQWNKKIEEIILPPSLKEIEYRAISDCPLLRYVKIPEGVKEIGSAQFDGCYNLREITIPQTVTLFGGSDLIGLQLNIWKYGKCFKIIQKHKWGSRDEQLLWKMLNDPALETFNEIKTASYKIALAERLYPDYEEYGTYLKKNIIKAIKDAVYFDDNELLESLRSYNFLDPMVFDEKVAIISNEKYTTIKEKYESAKKTIQNDSVINIDYLKGLKTDLEKISKYCDTKELLLSCSRKIDYLEERKKEKEYIKAINSMNEYGGTSWATLGPAIKTFRNLGNYKNSVELIKECQRRFEEAQNERKEETYQIALTKYNSYNGSNREDLEAAIDAFEMLDGYKNSEEILREYYIKYWDFDIEEGKVQNEQVFQHIREYRQNQSCRVKTSSRHKRSRQSSMAKRQKVQSAACRKRMYRNNILLKRRRKSRWGL